MKHLIVLLLVAPVLALSMLVFESVPGGACSCGALSDATAFARADAVFVGSVVGYEPPPGPVVSSVAPARWTFEVREVYKGAVARTQEVVSEFAGASCGLEIPKSGAFLVFGTIRSGGPGPAPASGQLYAGLCGGTRAVSEGVLEPGLARPRTMSHHAYALPSDGWKPGDMAMLALTSGEFHAVLTPDGACAWLGSRGGTDLWPAGYKVRFDPTRLLNAKGRVVAREGDVLQVGGGFATAPTGTRCVAEGQTPWHVQSTPVTR
jgi:hypothetical protein